MCKNRLQLHCQDTFLNHVRDLQESVHSCSCNELPKLLSTNCVDEEDVNSEFIVECLMHATENGKNECKTTTTKLSKIRVEFPHYQ